MTENAMDLEEIHTILKGATRVQNHLKTGKVRDSEGAAFNVALKWFKQCGIIDEKLITEEAFVQDYERLAPNREDLTLTQVVALFAIFTRKTRLDIDYFALKFEQVKPDIIKEIRDHWRACDNQTHTQLSDGMLSDSLM